MADPALTIYCVTAPLGEWSFRAHDRDGRSVVLDRFVATSEELHEVARQAAALAVLPTPSLCRTLEVGVWVDRAVVVREDRGPSLRERILAGPIEVRDLVRWGRRITETLAAVHAAHLQHGSLAPDCIYVSPDGEQVTIGGFGYAHLLRGHPECTPSEFGSRNADSRIDIFGAGVVLWEMATGEIAPADPTPATQLRRDLPLLLDRIIRTAMAPEREQRYAQASGMAKALRLFEEGEASPQRLERARSGSSTRRRVPKSRREERNWSKRVRWLKRLAWVCALGTVIFALYLFLPKAEPFHKQSMNVLTNTGDVQEAAISPDGARLAVIRDEPAGQSLWAQSAARQQAVRLMAPSPEPLSSLAFSRDGSTIYFVSGFPGTLNAIAVGGGAVRRYRSGVIAATVSPDEQKVAFLRTVGQERTVALSNLDGSADTLAFSRSAPAELRAVAWGPGGKTLAVGVFVPGEGSTVTTCQVDGTYSQHLGWHQWPGPISLQWLPTGAGLVVAGREVGGSNPLWRVTYPEGTTRPLTGLGEYSGVSLSANGKLLVSVRTQRLASLWVAPADASATPKRITKGDRPDGIGGLDWLDARGIVFATERNGARSLWRIDMAGRDERHVLSEPDRPIMPRVSPDGDLVAYIGLGQQGHRVWVISPEGKALRDLIRTGRQITPSFSLDGQYIYFAYPMDPALSAPDPSQWGIWRVHREGGKPEQVSREPAQSAAVSPNGKLIAYRTEVSGASEVRVIPIAGGDPEATLAMPEDGQISWTPDSRSIVWARSQNGVANLWAHDIAGGEKRAITRFTDPGVIYSFAWSRDGHTLAISRGRPLRDVVILSDQSWF